MYYPLLLSIESPSLFLTLAIMCVYIQMDTLCFLCQAPGPQIHYRVDSGQ